MTQNIGHREHEQLKPFPHSKSFVGIAEKEMRWFFWVLVFLPASVHSYRR